ncbi:Na+/H+ antiporter subunit E [Salinigranum halophilum]|uniref:Na+/H+ antiporter subunit E n=1 Tax=Salinigranum halophilum TaxID=2565931 RepID=UPI00191C18A6|nr:Na+/H+ antiporter subunit E [Salinigranum halophilum]
MTRLTAPAGASVKQAVLRFGATGAVAFGFYLVLGDPTDPFDVVTGLVSAAVVAAVLGGVVFERTPSVGTASSVLRAIVFVPALLVAVARANLALVVVVLDHDLPIDPAVVRIPAPEGRFARALLANSITLTPGTLTLDVVDDELVVHTLTETSRTELLEGSLARSVAFVTGESRSDVVHTDGGKP